MQSSVVSGPPFFCECSTWLSPLISSEIFLPRDWVRHLEHLFHLQLPHDQDCPTHAQPAHGAQSVPSRPADCSASSRSSVHRYTHPHHWNRRSAGPSSPVNVLTSTSPKGSPHRWVPLLPFTAPQAPRITCITVTQAVEWHTNHPLDIWANVSGYLSSSFTRGRAYLGPSVLTKVTRARA